MMAVEVHCPRCDSTYRVTEDRLGRRGRCKRCGTRFALESIADTADRAQAELDTVDRQSTARRGRVPEQVGRFAIKAKLGAGGFGAVYRAYDPVLEREVAVKVPHAHLLDNERDRQRYLREAKTTARLRHAHIVPVFEANIEGDNLFIVSAFIEGRSLDIALKDKRFDYRQAAELVAKLARALDYAHGQGIVHRDIKPANIMLDEQGEPLLMDFGLARVLESVEHLTLDQMVLGTPAYMSPEQAAGRISEISAASDQYSLGVVLYELLCGDRPFHGPPGLVISLVINEDPPAPSRHDAGIPPELESICLKMMAKKIEARYGTLKEAADALTANVTESRQDIRSRRATARRSPASVAWEGGESWETQRATSGQSSPNLRRGESGSTSSSAMPELVSWLRRHRFSPAVLLPAMAVIAALFFGIVIIIRTPDGTERRIETDTQRVTVAVDGDRLEVETPNADSQLARRPAEVVEEAQATARAAVTENADNTDKTENTHNVNDGDDPNDQRAVAANRRDRDSTGGVRSQDNGDQDNERSPRTTTPKPRRTPTIQLSAEPHANEFFARIRVASTIAASPREPLIAVATEQGNIGLFDMEQQQVLRQWQAHDGAVNALKFDASGQHLVSAADDQGTLQWTVEDGVRHSAIEQPSGTGPIRAVGFSPDGNRIAHAAGDGVTLSGGDLPVLSATGGITLDPRNGVFAWGTNDRHVSWCNFPQGLAPPNAPPISLWTGSLKNVLVHEFGNPGFMQEFLCVLVGEGQVQSGMGPPGMGPPGMMGPGMHGPGTGDPGNGQRIIQMFRIQPQVPPFVDIIGIHERPVAALALSPDARLLATASTDGEVRVWQLGRQPHLVSLDGGDPPIEIALTSDHHLIVLFDGGTMRAWKLTIEESG